MGMRNGFTLIEITIVVAISGMLLALLYQTYNNILQSRSRVASRSSYVTHMPLVYQQLARDIAGMYIPEPAIADIFAESEEQRTQNVRANTACMLSQSDNQFAQFSGITTNPMTLENTPNRVRFIYRLVTDDDVQIATLYRYQVSDLTKTPENVVNEQDGVKLLDGITSMNVTLLAPEPSQEPDASQQKEEQTQQPQNDTQQNQDSKQQQEQPVSYAEYTQWPGDQAQPQYIVPAYVRVELQGTDIYERQFDEQYTFAVWAYDGIQHTYQAEYQRAQKKQQQQQQQQQNQAAKPQQPSQQNTPQQSGQQVQQTRGGQQRVVTRRIRVPQTQPPAQVISQG